MFGPLYSVLILEFKYLKIYLDENLENGFIRKSTSPASLLIL